MKARRDYLEIYLKVLRGDKTVKEVAESYRITIPTLRTYTKFGRHMAITRYNKCYARASKLTDTRSKEQAFDEDLRAKMFPNNKI